MTPERALWIMGEPPPAQAGAAADGLRIGPLL
jgi:hypothetical protein